MTSDKVLKIDPLNPDQGIISQACELLMNGGVIVAPTETRYGLLTRADRIESIRRVYNIKRRDFTLPTAIFVDSVESLHQYLELSTAAKQLAKKHLPGPLTLVGQTDCDLKAPVVIDSKLGVRVSSSRIIATLTKQTGLPLTATSANLSTHPEPVTCGELLDTLADGVDLYLDGGRLEGPVSTVVDVTADPPRILRKGALTPEELGLKAGGVS